MTFILLTVLANISVIYAENGTDNTDNAIFSGEAENAYVLLDEQQKDDNKYDVVFFRPVCLNCCVMRRNQGEGGKWERKDVKRYLRDFRFIGEHDGQYGPCEENGIQFDGEWEIVEMIALEKQFADWTRPY